MATEKRLIDANELKRRMFAFVTSIKRDFLSIEAIIDRIDTNPTVDAVEVVRCEDCRFSKFFPESGTRKCRVTMGLYRTVKDSSFCSFGERKEHGRSEV